MHLQGGLLHLEIRFIKSAENNCIIIDSMISKKYIYVKYVKKYAILNKYYDFQKFDSVNLDKTHKVGSRSWSAVRKFDKPDTLTTHSTDLW